MMRFVFDEHVKRSASGVNPARARRRLDADYLKLIKLLYLADRAALIETGSPITGDRYVSMKFGPVLSNVLNLIKQAGPREDSIWHRYVRRENFDAVLVSEGGVRSACGVRR